MSDTVCPECNKVHLDQIDARCDTSHLDVEELIYEIWNRDGMNLVEMNRIRDFIRDLKRNQKEKS